MIGPVGRSDLAFKKNLLSTGDAGAVDQCPSIILAFAKRWWHLELAGLWQGHDESDHVGRVKINRIAGGQVIVWQEIGAEKELHCSFDDLFGDPFIHTLKFFTCLGMLVFVHSSGRLRTF